MTPQITRLIRTLLFCILSIITTFTACSAAAESQRPYRIGVIIPLSGSVASLGDYVRKGIELGIAQLPAEERKRIEVVFEDDGFLPAQTVSAYRKLSAQGRLDAVFTIGTPPSLALVPLTERDGTILVAIGASDSAITKGRRFAFIHWVIPPLLGKTLTAEIKRRDYKRIAFVISEGTGTRADMDATLAEFATQGMTDRLVYKEAFPKDQTDYRSVVARLRERKVDAIALVMFPGALAPFVKQVRGAGLKADLVGMETFEDEGEVKSSEGVLIGCWYVNASDPSDSFIQDYKARYHEQPGWASGNAYDSLRLVAQAATLHSNDNKKVAEFLMTLKDYDGASGRYSASGDNRFTLPAALKIVTATGFERLPR